MIVIATIWAYQERRGFGLHNSMTMTRERFMLRTIFTAATLLALAASGEAAIIVTFSRLTYLPNGGFISHTLTAVGTAGEVINTFSNPLITPISGLGIHNVWGFPGTTRTPSAAEHAAPFFNADWTDYDTYFKFGGADLVLNLGTPFDETNNGATAGTLGLSQAFSTPTNSGFGTYTSAADSTRVITPAKASSNVEFFQVVTRSQDTFRFQAKIEGNGAVGNIDAVPGLGPFLAVTRNKITAVVGVNVQDTFQAIFSGSTSPGTFNWTNFSFMGPGIANQPQFDSNTQVFNWNSAGSALGTYVATVDVNGGGSGPGGVATLTINLIPEPITAALAALAFIGCSAVTRRR
jgi:hypothetical protein